MVTSKFDRVILGKISARGGLVAIQFFGHLRMSLAFLISIRMSPSRNIFGPLDRYDHPWKKQELRAHMALVTRQEELRAKSSYGMSSNKILRINRLILKGKSEA